MSSATAVSTFTTFFQANLSKILIGVGLLIAAKIYSIGTPCRIKRDLRGRVVVVTGSNAGIGKETARALAKMNATVVFACRDEARTRPIITEIETQSNNKNLHFLALDLDDLESVRRFADAFLKKFDRLDILINNAGITPPKQTTTKQGFEQCFGVNHIAHFYLTRLLKSVLLSTTQSRVINVASSSHTFAPKPLNQSTLEKINKKEFFRIAHDAYAYSKLANVLFSRTLQKELGENKVRVVSLHPGTFIRTNIVYKAVKDSLPLFIIWALLYPLLICVTKNEEQGAQTTLYCALEDFETLKPGAYYQECSVKGVGKYARPQYDADADYLHQWTERQLEEKGFKV